MTATSTQQAAKTTATAPGAKAPVAKA